MSERIKTKYPGIYYKTKKNSVTGKEERIYYIQYRTPDGKQHHEKVGTTSTGFTDAKANAERIDRMRGRALSNTARREAERLEKEAEAGRWTMKRLWEEYKANKSNLQWMDTDEGRFQNYIKEPLGDLEPKEISHFHIEKIRKQIKKKHLAAASERQILGMIRRLSIYGENKNLCEGMKFKIQLPKLDNEKTEDLTPEQLQRLWETLETDENIQTTNMIKMVLFTGMRRGELFSLQWDDLNFERGFIRIKDPKGGKSQDIPMSESARKLLLSHERPYPNSPYVFPGKNGNKRRTVEHSVNRIKKRAGLPKDFRPLHGLRHVYASMLASSGKVDMYTLQKLLTHKDPKMTQRYAHLRDDALKKAAQVAVDVIGEALQVGKD